MPTVSVIMPVYNGDQYLEEAIESILGQSYQNFELIIIDDGSTDGTKGILMHYRRHPKVRIYHNYTNLGIPAALNVALQSAHGKYIARMDADDFSVFDRLERQVDYLNAHPECDVVAGHILMGEDIWDRNKKLWDDDVQNSTNEEIRRYLPKANCIADPTVMMRADVVREYYYNDCDYGACDYDLWLRMAADGRTFAKIRDCLLLYRTHPGQISARVLKSRPEVKNLRVKTRFLLNGTKACRFTLRTIMYVFRDMFYAVVREIRR